MLIEAMAAGLPVIGADIGGYREVVVDGETGLLVDPARIETLASAMARLAGNQAERRRMGENGRRKNGAGNHNTASRAPASS